MKQEIYINIKVLESRKEIKCVLFYINKTKSFVFLANGIEHHDDMLNAYLRKNDFKKNKHNYISFISAEANGDIITLGGGYIKKEEDRVVIEGYSVSLGPDYEETSPLNSGIMPPKVLKKLSTFIAKDTSTKTVDLSFYRQSDILPWANELLEKLPSSIKI